MTALWQREVCQALETVIGKQKKHWLVTGAAGFIGSHIADILLQLGQDVRGVDDFSTGSQDNLRAIGKSFDFREMDINDERGMDAVCEGVHYILHQAALGSVPRSMERPLLTHRANVTGFVTLLDAARRKNIERLVFASSSSVYGDNESLPKREDQLGIPLSPYAASKRSDELYAAAFSKAYGLQTIGLRYFNVFGPRQSPEGPYAAVLPLWKKSLAERKPLVVFGDGLTSRDFCFVGNVVYANILAALKVELPQHFIFNIAAGETTTLNQLALLLGELMHTKPQLEYRPFRKGDIRHSLADISQAKAMLGYRPLFHVPEGLKYYVQSA